MTEWVAKAKRTIRRSLITTLPLFAITALIPVAALSFPSLIPEADNMGTWFQRCGAVVVALAITIEAKNNLISGYIYPTGLSTSDFDKLKELYGLYFNIYKWGGFLLAIVGTIIWGYGDLLFCNA